jgi:putative membrane protein
MRKLILPLLIVYGLLTAYTVLGLYTGAGYQPFFTPLLSLLAFVFALDHGAQRMGWRRAGLLLVLTFAVSLLFESLGVATGLVYGPYHYTDRLGPKFLGLVPYLIPVAWFMMTYPSYVIAERLAPPRLQGLRRGLWIAAAGALAMTAWDLAMDPMMVAGGHWTWEVQGAFFGVPLHNFAGWWLTVFVTFALFLALGGLAAGKAGEAGAVRPRGASPDHGFDRLAIASYAITGLSSVIVNLNSGLGGPALAGLFAMLPWIVLGWQGRAA